MKTKEIIERSQKFIAPYRITNGKKFRLKDFDPNDTGEATSEDKSRAKELLERGVEVLAELQDVLYAQDQWSILVIFQAMDAAGKDGAIKHVMSGINPQGCQVFSFKSPSAEDLKHDFMWRCLKCLPERGRIGIFNRSYYEETLVVRIHSEFMAKQKIPKQLITKNVWEDRYEDMICNTATDEAPWFVVPADNKWFTRVVVAAAVIDALESLDLRYPEVGEAQRQELAVAKKELTANDNL